MDHMESIKSKFKHEQIREDAQYNNWRVVRKLNSKRVICQCKCGRLKEVAISHLMSGASRQCRKCGDTKLVAIARDNKDIYNCYRGMLARCNNPKDKCYYLYGAKGIKVCEEWNSFNKFFLWAKDKWEKGLQIDRINSNGNYEPSNCRFVTPAENRRNINNCKLSFKIAEDIRALLNTGLVDYKWLAKIYNVHHSTIFKIKKKQVYKTIR